MQMWYYESAIYIQKLRLVTMEAKGMKPEVTLQPCATGVAPEVGWHALARRLPSRSHQKCKIFNFYHILRCILMLRFKSNTKDNAKEENLRTNFWRLKIAKRYLYVNKYFTQFYSLLYLVAAYEFCTSQQTSRGRRPHFWCCQNSLFWHPLWRLGFYLYSPYPIKKIIDEWSATCAPRRVRKPNADQ